jgi:nitroreductase
MKMLKIMEKRRSVREYKERALDGKEVLAIDDLIHQMPQVVPNVQIKATLVEGTQVFERLEGFAGYHGVMIKAPHYLLLTAEPSQNYLKAAGYAGEWLVLQITKLDIATCWISTNNQEQKIHERLALPVNEEIIGIIAVGHAKNETRVSNIYGNAESSLSALKQLGYPHIDSEHVKAPVSGRVSIEDIVYLKEWGVKGEIERLEELGYAQAFFYMRLAPSSGNRQPWRFIIDRHQFVLAISRDDGYDDDRMALIEAGIAMLYFEVAMHGEGYPGQWSFESVENDYGIPENYLLAGTYQFI